MKSSIPANVLGNIDLEAHHGPSSGKIQRAGLVETYVNGGHEPGRHEPRVRMRYVVVSGPWIVLNLVAICTDVFLTFSMPEKEPFCWPCHPLRSCVTTLVVLVYWLDLALRIYAFRPHVFFAKSLNVFDAVVVLLTTMTTILEAIGVSLLGARTVSFLKIVRVLRVVLMLRIVRGACRTSDACCTCMRHITGQNKSRYVDLVHDFDLDLTYITPQLIAMGVPAAGFRTHYRNPLGEVVRFFERFHPGSYCIVNLCPELPYPAARFKTGGVHEFDIQDHTPPLLENFLEFLVLAQEFLSKGAEQVLAVHCKGGKGRTGSLCCAWLLYSGEAEDAEDARNFFALQRTDMRKDRKKKKKQVQGVETPSQVRYVEYIHKLLAAQAVRIPQQVKPPPRVRISLLQLRAHDFFASSKKAPLQLAAAVHDVKTRRVLYWSETDALTWQLDNFEVQGDVRISIFDRSDLPADANLATCRQKHMDAREAAGKRCLAGKEPGCCFYFLFHTSFLEGGELHIPMKKVDKAWKKPDKYNKAGQLELSFLTLWSADLEDME